MVNPGHCTQQHAWFPRIVLADHPLRIPTCRCALHTQTITFSAHHFAPFLPQTPNTGWSHAEGTPTRQPPL